MALSRIQLVDWRSWSELHLEVPETGLVVLAGANGVGKTNVLEAIGWAATQESFRGATRESLVRQGADRAVLRLETIQRGATSLIEAEVALGARDRLLVNRQAVRRRAELSRALSISVFTPDDLDMVKGAPLRRRRLLDELLAALDPAFEASRDALERTLRQRGLLLRQAGGRPSAEVLRTLDVWDRHLSQYGEAVSARRESLVVELEPLAATSYRRLAGSDDTVSLRYERSWSGCLESALEASRADDLRRGTSGVGPQRDELAISLAGRPARLQASQGEQRSLALSVFLAGHALRAAHAGSAPVLLLDDVLSELDEQRSLALMTSLPPGQVLLTTAWGPPSGIEVAASFDLGCIRSCRRPEAQWA